MRCRHFGRILQFSGASDMEMLHLMLQQKVNACTFRYFSYCATADISPADFCSFLRKCLSASRNITTFCPCTVFRTPSCISHAMATSVSLFSKCNGSQQLCSGGRSSQIRTTTGSVHIVPTSRSSSCHGVGSVNVVQQRARLTCSAKSHQASFDVWACTLSQPVTADACQLKSKHLSFSKHEEAC